MRLKENKTVLITCPKRYKDRDVLKIVEDKYDWIIKADHKKEIREERSYLYKGGSIFYVFGNPVTIDPDTDINKLYKSYNKEILKLAWEFFEKYKGMLIDYGYNQIPEIKIRAMKSKWGVCYTQRNSITLNSLLIHFPKECLEYVFLHELCHFIVPNHSKRFYSLIESRLPDYKNIKKKMV